MKGRELLKLLLPPLALEACRAVRRAAAGAHAQLAYAPLGWDTPLPPGAVLYENPDVIAEERSEWEAFTADARNGRKPLVTGDAETSAAEEMARLVCDHNAFMTFGYVLALAARSKPAVSVLDYGGSLGYFSDIARALLPEVDFEYHCKELPAMAASGRALRPEVTWHVDDACLERRYDLVMLSGSLPYLRHWRETLLACAAAAHSHLYVTSVATVRGGPGYVAMQRHAGSTMHYQVLGRSELLEALGQTGLELAREFLLGEHPPVAGRSERPAYFGCLLSRGGHAGHALQ